MGLRAVCVQAQGTGDAVKLALRVPGAKKLRLRQVLRRGFPAVVTCSRSCSLTALDKLDRRTASG